MQHTLHTVSNFKQLEPEVSVRMSQCINWILSTRKVKSRSTGKWSQCSSFLSLSFKNCYHDVFRLAYVRRSISETCGLISKAETFYVSIFKVMTGQWRIPTCLCVNLGKR